MLLYVRTTDYYCFNIDSYYIKNNNLYITIYVGSKNETKLNECLNILNTNVIKKFNFKLKKITKLKIFKSSLIDYKIFSRKVYLIGNKNIIERILDEYKKYN